jgi:hypothetical protein
MPFAFGAHVAEGGAFSILRFSEPDLSDVVYLEYLTDAVYVDKLSDVDLYSKIINYLGINSTPPDAFINLLSRVIDDM